MGTFRPPQTIMRVPVQIEVDSSRGAGAPLVVVAVQVSKTGSYRPPEFWVPPLQTIIRAPVQTAVA
jgi:hypothetical protein